MRLKIEDWGLKGPQARTQVILDRISEILAQYNQSMTVRQIFYRLVADQLIANTEGGYQKIIRIVRKGRYAGLIDWDIIVDQTRNFYRIPIYESPEQAIEQLKNEYHLDYWKDSPWHIIIFVEKATMLGVFMPVISEYDVTMTAGKGWGSASQIWETVKQLWELPDDKEIRILYFGDIDPSGWGMSDEETEGSVENRLNLFPDIKVNLERILLNEDDIDRYNLIRSYEVITKDKKNKLENDPRGKSFIRRFGDLFQVEVEAMDPRELTRRLREALDKYYDPKLTKRVQEQEKKDVLRIKLT